MQLDSSPEDGLDYGVNLSRCCREVEKISMGKVFDDFEDDLRR